MGERRKVAGGSEGPVLRHPRQDARGEQCEQPFDQRRAHSRQAGGERARAEQDHAPDDLVIEARTCSRCMAEHHRALQE